MNLLQRISFKNSCGLRDNRPAKGEIGMTRREERVRKRKRESTCDRVGRTRVAYLNGGRCVITISLFSFHGATVTIGSIAVESASDVIKILN